MTWGQGTCGSICCGHGPLPRPPRPAPRGRPPLALPAPLPAALARCHGLGARGGRAGLGPGGGSSPAAGGGRGASPAAGGGRRAGASSPYTETVLT